MANARRIVIEFLGEDKSASKAAEGVGRSTDELNRKMKATGETASKSLGGGFDRAGEAADNVDTKAMGFRDTLTGVQDTMKGASEIAKGNLFEGFLTLGMGIGDLGSGLYNFLIPSLKSLSKQMLGNAVNTVRSTASLVAHTVASKAAAAATKIWAGVQWVLNAALTANPIGLVVVAIAALAAGIVIAYKRSETFRKVVDGAFTAVKKAVSAVVAFFKDLGPSISKAVGAVTGTLTGKGKDLIVGLAKGVYNNVKGFVTFWVQLPGNVARWIGDTAKALGARGLGFVTGLARGVYNNLTGFARFWAGLPGSVLRWLGDTSKTLASRGSNLLGGMWSALIDKWRSIGTWISGLRASALSWLGDTSKTLAQKGRDLLQGFWVGLTSKWAEVTKWVSGIATWIKDHKGPVSLDARLLIPAGQAIMSGFLKGLKSGAGPAWDFVKGVGGKSVDTLKGLLGTVFGSGSQELGGRRVRYQGEQLDLSTFQKIRQAENILGSMIRVTQGSYESASSFSGSTHTGGGVFDVVGGNLERINAVLRSLGFASWVRNPSQGPWPWHVHAIEMGNPRVAASARRQAQDYLHGGDGLGGYKQGTPWVPDDQFAFLHRGEAVIPADVNRRRLAAAGDGAVANLTVNLVLDGKVIQTSLVRLKKLNGGLALGLA